VFKFFVTSNIHFTTKELSMRRSALLIAALAVLLLAQFLVPIALAQDYTNWKYTHPKPQANLLRKTQMIDANTWVAVGANGTFMRSTDAGVNWYFHNQAGKASNTALAIGQNYDVWFFNATNGIVAGDRGYIGKTTNGGVAFDSVANGLVPVGQRCQSIWFANQNTGYVGAGSASGSNGTIVKTTDGGTNWTSVYGSTVSSVQAVAGTDAQTAYAVLANGSVLKTTDGGTSWSTPVPSTVGQFMYGMSFVDSLTGFVAGGGGLISKTTDAGATWGALTPPQTNWSYFQVKIISSSEIYLVGDPQFLWKSTDLGSTWSSLSIMPVAGPSDTYIWYSLDKQGSVMTLSGDYGVVAQSTNGGTIWSSNSFLLTTQLMFDIQKVPGTNNMVAVGRQRTSGTRSVFYSSNAGKDWSTIDVGVVTDLNAVSMVNSQIGYACGTNSQVLKTTDGGLSWAAVTRPHATNYTLQAMEFVDANTGWVFVNFAAVSGGNIFKTTDGGTSWAQQTIGTTDQIAAADMVDANTGYLCLNPSGRPIYKTTNGGTNWTSVTIPFTGQIKDIRATDANTVYICTTAGTNRVAKTTDGGTTWTQITLPITVDASKLDFKDANTGYVAGNTTTAICKTTDGGSTWSFQNVHLPTLVNVYVNPGDTAYALGTYSSILRWAPAPVGPQPLSGTKTIGGTSPDYATIKAAIKDLNLLGVQSPGVTFLIRSGTYAEDSLRIRTATSNASAPITIMPDAGATVVVNVTPPSTSYNFAFSVDTTSFVTISGIPLGGTATDRNMTINALGINGQVGVRVYGNSDNCTAKNVIVSCSGSLTSSAVRGVDIRYSAQTQIPDSSTVDYVYVKRANVGIRVEGYNVTNPVMRTWIQNCSIATGASDSVGGIGISNANILYPVIRGNTIRNLYGTSTVSGISIGTQCGAAQVYNNTIATLRTSGTGSNVNGIQQISTQDVGGAKYYNNMISDINGVATGTGPIYGFYISGGSNAVADTFYYNSVNLSGTGTGLRKSAALGLEYFGGTPIVVVRNNVFVNTRQNGLGVNSFATTIYKAIPAATINSNYNDLYVSPTPDTTRATAVYFIATSRYSKYATLGDFRFATGLDNNSVVENPAFLSAADLHLNTATPTNLESSGTPVSVSSDLDGDVRNTTTPDIGADEGSFTFVDVMPPVISHAALPPAPTSGGRVTAATITDITGIQTGAGGPRLWHKSSTDPTYTAAAVDSTNGNTFYFTIPGRATGTTVQYYLAAQDLAPANNVGTWPPGGSGINPPGSVAPANVFSYLVQAPLPAGSYSVGAGGYFPTLDSAFRKLSVDGIAGAVTLNLTDSVYAIPGQPRRTIRENAPQYETVNGKREALIQINPYEYEREDAPTIALQTLAGPIIGAGPSNRITIRPAAGRSVTLSGSGTYILRLLDASYVTIDGINSGGASLEVRNTAGNGLQVEGNSDNNIIQNISLAVVGLGGWGINIQNTDANSTPDFNLVQNNTFAKGWVGVAVNANQSLGYATGNRITRNLIKFTEADSLNQIGIFFQNAAGTLIDNNAISRMRNFITIGTPTGISGQGRHRNTRIWNNLISDIIHINSFDVSAAYGINITATVGETTQVAVYNNMIYGIDDQTVGNGRGSRGISFTTGINDTIAYNTVYLSGSDGWLSAALYNNYTAFSASRVWRNNIAINERIPQTGATTYAFVLDDATSQISSNYNDLYVPSNINSYVAGGFTTAQFSYRTLLDWQSTGRDLNSVSVPVAFRSSADLHVDSTIATSINNAGTPIAGITTDFDGQARSVTTPDVGADEFAGIAIAHDIGVISLQEVVPPGTALDNIGKDQKTVLGLASDVTPVATGEGTVEGAMIRKSSKDGILLEVLADTVKYRALVRNFGTLPETTYQVRWTMDGTVQATLSNPRILGAGARDTLLLQWNNAAPGAHLLQAWTLLATDVNRVNDSTSMTIIGPATVPAGIYNNGPVFTGRLSASGVAAPAGFRWSELQAIGTEANTLLGSADVQNSSSRYRLADDFTVPTGQSWRIDSLVTYSYQQYDPGYSTPYTSANVRIWRGAPDSAGSTVVFGDTLANRLTTSYNSRIYRISNSTTPAPGTVPEFSRVLYQNTLSAGVTLVPGRYFVDWQTATDPANFHYAPTVTVPNRRGNAAWNARQRATNGVWSNVIDTGNPSAAPDSAQDFPFVLMGSTGSVLAHDIGVASAVQLPVADTVRFRALVWNFGATPETTYQVRWSIDGTVQTTFGNGRILGIGDIDTVLLNWTAPSSGNHTLRAWTILGTDGNHTNDTLSLNFNFSAGWTFNNSGTGNTFNSVKAVDGNIGWAGGNNATVLRTTDGGASWASRSTTTISGDVYAIEALTDSLAFVTTTPAGSSTRIYRTTNTGTTWTSVFTLTGGFIDAIKMYNTTTGIALGDPVGGKWTVLKTTNGGAAWARIATEPTAVGGEAGLNNSLSTYDTTHIWFGTTNGTVYRSTDGGLTWASSATTFTGQVDEVAFNGPLFGVAGGLDAASRTTDGGVTWLSTNIGGTGYVLGLAATGDEFWAAQGENVYRSTNRGATWATSYTGTIGSLRHLDFTTVGLDIRGWTVSGTGGIAAAWFTPPVLTHDIGVFSLGAGSLSDERTSEVKNATLRSGANYKGKADTDGGITLPADNSTEGSIIHITDSSPNAPLNITALVRNYGNFVEPTYQVGWTIDGAAQTPVNQPRALQIGATDTLTLTWTTPTAGAHVARAFTILASDANHSNDTSAPYNFNVAVGPFDDFEAYTVGQQLACQNPIDWTTWSILPCNTTEDPLISNAFAFSGTKSVVIVQNNDLVRRHGNDTSGIHVITFKFYVPSSKAGYFNTLATFTPPSTFNWAMEAYFDSAASGSNGRLFAGSATAVPFTYTHNAWQTMRLVLNLNIDSARFVINGNVIRTWRWTAGASGGTSPKRLAANDFFGATAWDQMYMDDYDVHPDTIWTGVKEQSQEIPVVFALEQNYPNPFNPTTTLRYALPKDARVSLTIYNILGQRIATLRNEVQNVGFYDVLWNGTNDFGSQIASGVYFYRIEAKPVDGADAFTSIKKMMFLK
jgi:photosystem II stability/assembly factor-like uncharacterized protein